MTLETRIETGTQVVGLPRTDHLPAPRTGLQTLCSRVGMRALRTRWSVTVHDACYVPRTGPVIIASNHIGTLDGPLAVLAPPRPVFVLAKAELFSGFVGQALEAVGQIPIDRSHPDFGAVRRAIHVLRRGQALAIFPEGRRDDGEMRRIFGGAAYLALVTGAPVVPCAFLGTRLPGAGRKALPSRGARIEVVFGKPIAVDAVPWPRRREQVADATEFLRRRLAAHVAGASEAAGIPLPGPVAA